MQIPFISQYSDLNDPTWKWRGCGVAALAMIMEYWHLRDAQNQTVSIEELLKTGLELNAYREGIGWTHRGLVEIAQRYGYEAFNADYAPQSPTPKSLEETWQELTQELERGPVMASVYAGLDPARGGGHIVVITGITNGEVAFNDPEASTEQEGRKNIPIKKFLAGFKQRYIIVRPHIAIQ